MIRTAVGALAVRVHGAGPIAVLWHSLFVDDRSWRGVEALLARDRRLVVITGPGHGASEDPGRVYTLEGCAAAATTVLDALGVDEPVDWVGNAWGGHVGVVFAATQAARCRSLVTIGAPIPALGRMERLRMRVLIAGHRLFGPAGFIRSAVVGVMLSARTRAQVPASAVELVEDCLSAFEPGALRNAVVSASLRRPDLSDHLGRIAVPTLIATGSEHSGWTPDQARATGAVLERGSVAVVPGAAYLAPLEAPEETGELVRRFWATTVSPGNS